MLRSSISAYRERWADLHPVIRFLVLIAVLAGCGLLALKPGYRAFKDWRIQQNLTSARKAIEGEQMLEARDLSLSVLQAGDPCIEAYRILEKSTASLRDPRHGDVARMLMSHPQGSDEDRLTGFLSITNEAPLGVVGQAWVALPPGGRIQSRFAAPFADRLIADRRFNEAASVLLAVPEEMRDGPLKRNLIRVLIGSGKKDGFDEAQRLIVAGFPDEAAEAPAWLDLLESVPALGLQQSLLAPLRSRLEDSSFGDPARLALILARIEYASQYPWRGEILASVIQRWKDPAPEALARFLSDLGVGNLLLEVFPPERVKETPGLFPWVLAALEDSGAWEQVVLLLDTHGHLLPKVEAQAHRAIAISKTGKPSSPATAWSAVIEQAKVAPDTAVLLKLHCLAAHLRMPDEAEAAMLAAIRSGRGPLPLYSELKPLLSSLEQQGRENQILEISAIYLQFEPGNPVLLTQYAYLACLNQLAEPATILKALVPLSEAFPKEKPIQIVLAAVYLCDGQCAKAAEILAPLNLDPAQMPPPYRIVLLVTQILNHQKTPDDPLIKQFPWKSLLPSESRKFSELIRSAKS